MRPDAASVSHDVFEHWMSNRPRTRLHGGRRSSRAEATVILSDNVATGLFGSAPSAVGRTVRLDTTPYTIIGVMPPGFAFPWRDTDMWLSLKSWDNRSNRMLSVIARTRPEVSLKQARADMDVIANSLRLPIRGRTPGSVSASEDAGRHVATIANVGHRGVRRRVLSAADRLHQPGESVVRARHGAQTGDRGAYRDRSRARADPASTAYRKPALSIAGGTLDCCWRSSRHPGWRYWFRTRCRLRKAGGGLACVRLRCRAHPGYQHRVRRRTRPAILPQSRHECTALAIRVRGRADRLRSVLVLAGSLLGR